ncbi:MAG: serine protein kinase RIO [Thermoplasmatales archaeon]|jgi:RIO kinase 1|nr:MAG: serine protein kinase RIO [Thermoplasmatales archaeon]
MSSDIFLNDKQLKTLDKKLQSIIRKTGLDRKTQAEVFDKKTLLTIEKLISNRVLDIIDFPISTGKEGNVFRGVTTENKLVAVKIYRISTSTFKHITQYIFGDPRFKSIHKTRQNIIYAWTKKEFKNLERLNKIGVKAPKPIISYNNVLVMQYLGEKNKSAPMLKDVKIENPEEIYESLIGSIKKMYQKADLVHGDISEYNILYYRSKPYIIDLGQGVLNKHPNAQEFLKRDINNLVRYFKKYGIKANVEKIFDNIIK